MDKQVDNTAITYYQETKRVTLVGAIVNLLLAAIKIIIGYSGHSQALVADGLHSLSDLLSDFLVVFAAKIGHKQPDADHPYGHARIETAISVVLGLLLFLVAIGIAIDAIDNLLHSTQSVVPESITLFIALLSVLSKEALYHYTMFSAKKFRSRLLKVNAWHHRSDAFSSIIVLLGIAASLLGYVYLDAIAALIVAFMITKIAWEIAWNSILELVDTGLSEEQIALIRQHIQAVDGVVSVHMLRTRRMGADTLVDAHIQVDAYLSVSEGHHISEQVQTLLMSEIEDISEVLVHIDPENDEEKAPCLHLPTRKQLLYKIEPLWKHHPLRSKIKYIILHYINGKITMQLVLPLDVLSECQEKEELLCAIQQQLSSFECILQVEILYQ